VPVFNLLIYIDFKEMRTVTAAVSTCHFDSVDIVTP